MPNRSADNGLVLVIVLFTATPQIPFGGQSIAGRAVRFEPLTAGLAADALQRESKREGAALLELAEALIVALPGHAKLQAFIFVSDAETMTHRLISVRQRQWILFLAGEVEHGRPEQRPIAR